jgi:tetratricopeptide (TPR) repeat protein
MIAALLAAPLFSLAQTIAEVPPPAPPRTVAEDRLALCLEAARTDPATAIGEASEWAEGLGGADASYPRQCLGFAYTALLRWEAAEAAFLAARDAALPTDAFRRAQLGAMAANAALAEGRAAAALAILDVAARDALAAGDAGLRAMTEVDRARAQVLAGDEAGAEATLASARALDAQNGLAWLLSATLARRLGKLDEAQSFIETAAALDPADPETALEAGVIAMLAGREDAAAASWNSVIAVAPGSPQAATARGYLAQLAEPAGE